MVILTTVVIAFLIFSLYHYNFLNGTKNGHFPKSVSLLGSDPSPPGHPLNSSEEDPTPSPLSIYTVSTNPFGFFPRGILIKVPKCLIQALKSLILDFPKAAPGRSLGWGVCLGCDPGVLVRYRRLVLLGICLRGHSRWASWSIYSRIPSPTPMLAKSWLEMPVV